MLGPAGAGDPFGRAGCPACHATPEIEAGLVGWFAAQGFDDADTRRRVRAAGGLCPRHWWLVLHEERRRRASALGTALLLAQELERGPATAAGAAPCPLCEDVAGSVKRRLGLLLAELGTARLERAPQSWRPCLAHLQALRRSRPERWLDRWVQQREAAVAAAAADAARRYARTREQRHHHEASGEELDELVAAMAALLGPSP